MSTEEDIRIDVPFMETATAIINKHIDDLDARPLRVPNHNDELELLTILMGLARCVEFNIRIAYEHRFGGNAPSKYSDVRFRLSREFPALSKLHTLLELVDIAAGGMVHGNFPTVEAAVRRARVEIPSVATRDYPLATIVRTVFTAKGLAVDMATGTARDQQGQSVPSEAVAVRKAQPILDNLFAFYQREVFSNVYELLVAALEVAVVFRERARRGLLGNRT